MISNEHIQEFKRLYKNRFGKELTDVEAREKGSALVRFLKTTIGRRVAVNPASNLERVAGQHGWPFVVFSKRTKAVIRRTTQAVGAVGLTAGGFAGGIRWARHR